MFRLLYYNARDPVSDSEDCYVWSRYLFFMAALRSRCGHYIFAVLFLSIFLFFFIA